MDFGALLKGVLAENGADVFRSSKRLRGLLADMGAPKRYAAQLGVFVDTGHLRRFTEGGFLPDARSRNAVVSSLCDDTGYSREVAEQMLDWLVYALAPSPGTPAATVIVKKPASSSDAAKNPLTGFLAQNTANGGIVAYNDGWLFCRNEQGGKELFKMRRDGSGMTKLNNHITECVNVTGDMVYYRDVNERGRVFRVSANGGLAVKVIDADAKYLIVAPDGTAYYADQNDGKNIYAADLKNLSLGETARSEKICSDVCRYINAVEDGGFLWLFYVNVGDGNKVYKIRADGTGRRKISDDNAAFLTAARDEAGRVWLFYSNWDDGQRVYKVGVDGGSDKKPLKLVDDRCGHLNVRDDWVFYVNLSDGGKLYKIKADGAGRVKLFGGGRLKMSDVACEAVCCANGSVFYLTEDETLYKMRPDGAERRKAFSRRGNSLGNSVNGGYAVRQGGYVYFRDGGGGNRLYRSKENGSGGGGGGGKVRLASEYCAQINVIGAWCIYRAVSDGGRLYKIRVDGKMKGLLADGDCDCVNAVESLLYYIDHSKGDRVFSVGLEGGTPQMIIDAPCSCLNADGDRIFFINDDDGKIYRTGINGEQPLCVCPDRARALNAAGEWLYFCNLNDGSRVTKIRADGTGKSRVCADGSYWLNVSYDHIFYANAHDEGKLYRVRTDGKERTRLCDDDVWNVSVCEDAVFYLNASDKNRLYRINADGTGRAAVR